MALGYCAFAREGNLAGTLPKARLVAVSAEEARALDRDFSNRVLPAHIATLTRETMRGITHNLDERLLFAFVTVDLYIRAQPHRAGRTGGRGLSTAAWG